MRNPATPVPRTPFSRSACSQWCHFGKIIGGKFDLASQAAQRGPGPQEQQDKLLFSNSLISSSSLYSRLYQLTLTLIYPNSVFKPIHKSIQRPKTVFINLYAIFLSKKRFLGDDCPPPPSYYYFFQLRSMFKFWRIVLGTMDLSRTVILEYLSTSPSYSRARAQELVFVIP